MATSSEKEELVEKIYEFRGKFYRVIENADFHTHLKSGKLRIRNYIHNFNS